MELSEWIFNSGQRGPVAAREEYVHGYHRKEFKDYYHWLRSGDEKTKQYLQSENAFSRDVLLPLKSLVGEIREELESFKGAKDDYPFKVGEYIYFDDKSHGLSNYTREIFGERELVKDFNEFNASTVVGTFAPSPYNDRVAYTIDPKGGGDYQLFIKDMCTNEEILALENICENIIWSEEGDHLFYTTRDEYRNPFRLMRYSLADKRTHVVYSERSKGFRVEITQSTSKRYLFVNTESDTNNEIHFLDLKNPTSKIEVILPRHCERLYYVEHYKKEFWIRTNHYKQAYKNFAVHKATITTPWKWILAIPYNSTEYITGMYGFRNAVALEVRVEGIQHIKIVRNHLQHLVSFPEPVFHAKLALKQLEYATKKIHIVYSSPITPYSLMEYDLVTELKTLLQDSYPEYNPKLYSVERIYTNTGVPITLVYMKSLLDGNNPLLLEGYGGYGVNLEPNFQYQLPSLLNRGFIYAIAHVRGGSELGEQWYEHGKLLDKNNSFSDFAECARHLRALKLGSHITAKGFSAGGLLVAATINQNPKLFQAAIINVPFVDVLNTMMDPTLPYTIADYGEWGNPNNITFFNYIQQYSPYDNIPTNPTHFPDLFVRSSLNDDQVQFWEPAKYVAKVRHLTSYLNLTIIHTIDMDGGHSSTNAKTGLQKYAEDFAFIITSYTTWKRQMATRTD